MRDECVGRTIGNLIGEPKVITDTRGRTLCEVPMATNPNAKKGVPYKERTKRRTIINVVAFGKWVQKLSECKKGDKVEVTGEFTSRWQPLRFRSKETGEVTALTVEFEGRKILIGAPQLSLRIYKFRKLEHPQRNEAQDSSTGLEDTAVVEEIAEEVEAEELIHTATA